MDSRRMAFRAKLFAQRVWQPTSACLTCMPGHFANVVSLPHWEIALRTGLLTGAIVVLLSFTRFVGVFRNRYGNAAVVAGFTAIGDALAHPDHYGSFHREALVTGLISGLLALAASFVLEDRARRLRSAWARLRGN
ncbi:MAG: hypothetical protein ABI277_08405 [Burkholderiaceae bacterium]